MTDYQGFIHGAVTYPLSTTSGMTLLHDADPAIFYLLEFYQAVLEKHLGPRLMAEVASGGLDHVQRIVGDIIPLNPEPYLTEQHITFPLLCAYRKRTRFENIGGAKFSVDDLEVAYVFPPMQAGEAERVVPLLKAVVDVLDNRTEQGFDPSYTPTQPVGTAGEHVWRRAGVASAGVTEVSYGGYPATDALYFPAVMLTVELKSKSGLDVSELELYDGANVDIDVEDSRQETVVDDVVQFKTGPAPTLSLSNPSTGPKTGGTTVYLTGTNFVVGTTPTVTFGGLPATDVVVLSATQIQCKAPAHDAFPTFMADVVVTNTDDQSATLVAAYTFTTP